MQVAQRHWNAHAFINMAVWLNVIEDETSANEASHVIKDARIVFGYPAASAGTEYLLCASRARLMTVRLLFLHTSCMLLIMPQQKDL